MEERFGEFLEEILTQFRNVVVHKNHRITIFMKKFLKKILQKQNKTEENFNTNYFLNESLGEYVKELKNPMQVIKEDFF